MIKTCLFIMLLLPRLVSAEWVLEQTGDGHGVSSKTAQQHRLVVAGRPDNIQFLLILAIKGQVTAEPQPIVFRVDTDAGLNTQIEPLQLRPHGMVYRIVLSEEQKDNIIHRMIAGLTLQIKLGKTAVAKQRLDFSLIGFTAAFSDLMIVNDVGRLDPDWLHEQGRDRELACYYSSVLTVKALQARRRGRSFRQAIDTLPITGLALIDDRRADIVTQVYKLPVGQVPHFPMMEKYNMFKRCMSGS